MGIWDSLFGSKKGPARGRASLDDDEGARQDFTRAIPREEMAQKRAPVDDWDPAPVRPPAAPEAREESPPVRRPAPPPPPPAPAPRAYSPPPPAQFDGDEPPPTEYAKVSRVGVLKVAGVLLGVEGPLEGHVIRIYQGENVIGREAEPEARDSVPSSHASISRKHAKLIADGGYFVLEPVQLKNATLAGGAPVDTHAVLQHGDRITLGTTKPCTFVLLAVPA